MALLFFRLWPIFIPLAIYWLWMLSQRRKARKAGSDMPRFFKDGPWYWAVVASLVIGVGLLVLLGLTHQGSKGEYIPPHMENGTIIPGYVADEN